MRAALRAAGLGLLAAALGACANQPRTPPDYTAFRASRPRSVLVLPPVNNSTDVRGTYGYLSTVTRPLAEMGYYVFPVAMVDQFLKENGLPTAGEMHQAPLAKFREVFGADAVLYLVLERYGTKYQLLASRTEVAVKATLVDARDGVTIWSGQAAGFQSGSGNSGGGLVGMLVEAAVSQAVNSSQDTAHQLSAGVSRCLFDGESGSYGQQCFGSPGVLYGPYHPDNAMHYEEPAVSSGAVTAPPR